ncbi:hypothetical protein Q7P37_002137 [Cladosporium fusiforme]
MANNDTFKTLLNALAILGLCMGLLGVASHYWQQPLRRLRLRIWARRCYSLTWEDVPPGDLRAANRSGCCAGGPSHPHNQSSIRRHERAPACWTGTVGDVLGVAWSVSLKREIFPPDLDDQNRFLRIDKSTFLAFILGAIPEEFPQPFCTIQNSDAAMYKVGLQKGHVVVHLRGTHQRKLSKQDCIGLIAGYPPWYRETLIVNYPPELPPWTMHHPLTYGRQFTSRAGWVIAVALSDTRPVPIYVPDPAGSATGRGRILRNGCKRVLAVLERKDVQDFCRGNSTSSEYELAIGYIKTSIKTNTDSASSYVRAPDAGLMQPDWWRMICRAVIEIFDKPPKPPNGDDASGDISSQLGKLDIVQSKRDVVAQLILHWASRGVFEVIAYVKNDGRELILDSRLAEVSDIYVEDCRAV